MRKLPPDEALRRKRAREKAYRDSPVGKEARKAAIVKWKQSHWAQVLWKESWRSAKRQHGGVGFGGILPPDDAIALVQSWLDRKPAACEFCGRQNCRLVLDHNHVTGRIRAWLCHQCNTMEGYIATGRVDRMKAFIASREEDNA